VVARRSGCLGKGDGVAEGFELADVTAGLAVLVDPAGVAADDQIQVARCAVSNGFSGSG